MKNEELQRDIRWFKERLLPYMAINYHRSDTLTTFSDSCEMKNILFSYGKEKLYKEDLERIIEMAEMLI